MPYLVTTTTPEPALPPIGNERDDGGPDVTRRAGATLEEARAACHAALTTCDLNPAAQFDAQYAIQYRVNASGGTVGPLADGTVIEVAPARWIDLIDANDPMRATRAMWADGEMHPHKRDQVRAEIIDAYNAR